VGLTCVKDGEYLHPADRILRIRETRAIVPDWDALPVWIELGVLGIPGLDQLPRGLRDNREVARKYIAHEDWKRRCKRKRRVSPRFRRIVIGRSDGRCWYCGKPVADADFEIDHIVPVARGGRSYLRNLAACCGDCNESKSDQLVEEWLEPHLASLQQIAREVVLGRA
jgi:hypothetical protein